MFYNRFSKLGNLEKFIGLMWEWGNVMKKEYKPIRYYKKFKKDYLQFVVFIKGGQYYYTFDSDAKIMCYICHVSLLEGNYVKIKKSDFTDVLKMLHEVGLNVILAGYKNVDEFYTELQSQYMKVRAKSKAFYRATTSGVQ